MVPFYNIQQELYIVLFLHQTTTRPFTFRETDLLYIVLFLHQTTTSATSRQVLVSCISYYSYIKPQLCRSWYTSSAVVYRTIPTSNHNCLYLRPLRRLLYIVLFLHQTTTYHYQIRVGHTLYIVLFLHQTTTEIQAVVADWVVYRTIPTSNHNGIDVGTHEFVVVYRTIPTSNHNC